MKKHFQRCIVGSLIAGAASSPASAAIINASWVGPSGGNWSLAANWNRSGVPNNGGGNSFNVTIDNNTGANTLVNLNMDVGIDSLTVNAGDELFFQNDRDMAVTVGPITNNGVISMNSSGNSTDLRFGSNVLITGSGVLLMSNHGNNILRNNFGGLTRLQNGASHTIRGAGQIGINTMFASNDGLIDATQATALQFDLREEEVNFNNGTLQASLGGTLNLLNSGTIDNTGGVIQALDASTVNIMLTAIQNGELTTAGTGAIHPSTNVPSFENILNTGLIQHLNDQDAAYVGSITNDGTISLESIGNGTDMRIASNPTFFLGTGDISMGDHQNNIIRNNFGGLTRLFNTETHTIQGAGQIGINTMFLSNLGLIDANLPTTLQIDLREEETNVNNGVMQASSGGTMTIFNSGVLDNTTGVIQALDQSVVNIAGTSIVSGTLHTEGSGVIRASTNVPLFQDVTLTGLLEFPNDADAAFANTFTNNGVISMNSTGNGTDVRLHSAITTMTGTGEIAMGDHPNNFIRNNFGPLTRLVNDVDHVIHGAGQIGLNSMFLTNHGLIDATQPVNVLQLDLREEETNFNNGIMQASGAAGLNILNSGTIDNTAGVIQALDGSVVNVMNTTILGGELVTEGSGVIHPSTSVPLFQDLQLTGLIEHLNDQDAAYAGTITNNGTIRVASTANGTDVRLHSSPTVFAGKGEIVMTDNGNNIIRNNFGPATSLTNGAGHTIRGGGQIGLNSISILNQGSIISDQPAGFSIDANGSGFDNQGLLHASGGNISIQTDPFTTSGAVTIDATRTLTRVGNYSQTGGKTTVNGTLTVNSGGAINIAGGTLKGSGTTTGGAVNNSAGRVEPGNSTGTLTITGAYTQGNDATFAVEIGGVAPGEADKLAVSAAANLDGTLEVMLAGTFAPVGGENVTILTASAINGTFDSVVSCVPVSVVYTATTVNVTFGTPNLLGDFNGDGEVGPFDLAQLLATWGECTGICCPADFNHDGQVGPFDLAQLLAHWG